MRTLLIAVLSSILFVSISASPVSAQNIDFDGVYEISVSRVFLKGNGSTKRGTQQLMHVAKVEVRGNSVRFLELTTNNARAGRGIVFRGFQGNISQSGVLSFSTRVSDALYNDEKNNASILRASVPLKVPSKVGQTVAVAANDFNPRYGSHVSIKTLKLYKPSQPNTVASNTLSSKANAPQQATPRNSRNVLKSVIQPRLAELGYYTGAIDGIAGPQTDRAIAAFESSLSGQNDGYLDATEIAALVAAAEAKRQTTSVPQVSDANDSVQTLQAENERLRLELENARLRQELEAAKQQGQPAPEATADAVVRNGSVPSNTSDNVAILDPMTANFDGLYKPKGEQFAHWDCKSVGRDGGALEISGNTLTLIEESCTLSDPSRVAGSSEIAYYAQCAVEGTEYEAQVALRKTDFGVVFSGDGFSAEWQSCEAVKAGEGLTDRAEMDQVVPQKTTSDTISRQENKELPQSSIDKIMLHSDDCVTTWTLAVGVGMSVSKGHINRYGEEGTAKLVLKKSIEIMDVRDPNNVKLVAELVSAATKFSFDDDDAPVLFANQIEQACLGAEADQLAAQASAERLAAEKAEAERLAAEKAEAKRLAAEKAEAERLAAEKAEAERIAAEKAEAEAEQLAAEHADADGFFGTIYNKFFGGDDEQLVAEKAEVERLAAEKAEAERLAAEKAQERKLAAEEKKRTAAEKEKAKNSIRSSYKGGASDAVGSEVPHNVIEVIKTNLSDMGYRSNIERCSFVANFISCYYYNLGGNVEIRQNPIRYCVFSDPFSRNERNYLGGFAIGKTTVRAINYQMCR